MATPAITAGFGARLAGAWALPAAGAASAGPRSRRHRFDRALARMRAAASLGLSTGAGAPDGSGAFWAAGAASEVGGSGSLAPMQPASRRRCRTGLRPRARLHCSQNIGSPSPRIVQVFLEGTAPAQRPHLNLGTGTGSRRGPLNRDPQFGDRRLFERGTSVVYEKRGRGDPAAPLALQALPPRRRPTAAQVGEHSESDVRQESWRPGLPTLGCQRPRRAATRCQFGATRRSRASCSPASIRCLSPF